ncbi:hypothetical protein HK099_000020 [Clydaea vesicula]|uniref:Uncharacterized protein n=1 Tax=Clydaea vesicula TaxID=447962 RepID=A0AAD5Y3X6_9FUNG|nr:hypothetical protein HK099_000020 [Clydaea vesicula]KAJ3395440.1 hypothetical protein HDU92_005830 [Lobulomyces angularis]
MVITASTTRNNQDLQSLYQLQHDIREVVKGKTPKLNDIQELGERTFKANILYENTLAKLEREKRKLESVMKHIWDGFDRAVLPLWKVDDELISVYDDLVTVMRSLEELNSQKDPLPSNSSKLLKLQEELHIIENDHCVNGLYVPLGWKRNDRIPTGQSILALLFSRNYKLVRHIQEKEPTVSSKLIPLELRLRNIVHNLQMIKDNYTDPFEDEFGPIPIDQIEIGVLQEQLSAIENLQVDGKFVDDDGSVPSGQGTLHSLLEEGYDLVHDCLIAAENKATSENDLLNGAINQARHVADSIFNNASRVTKDMATEARSVSLTTLHTLQATLEQGSDILKKVVVNPADSLKSTSKVLASSTRGALGFLNKLYGEFEPVDPSLLHTYAAIKKIRNDLKLLRNEIDLIKLRPNNKVDEVNLNKRLRILQEELDIIDGQKVDGKFLNSDGDIPRGQALLSSLLDESYCLIAEII